MNVQEFTAERAAAWQRLERLLGDAGSRPERLGVDGLLELGGLYRASAADLALARRRFPGYPVVERLEPLVARARSAIYGERTSRAGALADYVLRGYWREIRAHGRLLALSIGTTAISTLAAAAWAVHDPEAAVGLLPSAYRAAASPHVHRLPGGISTNAALASTIYTHNITVAFAVFAGGLLLGLGTLWLLAYNGILLGTLGGLTISSGTFSVFLRYVLPHGILELSCISVAGLAGLRLARALVDPGIRPRAESLRREARGAVPMVIATAPYLVIAGVFEGFVTPEALPLPAALAVGCSLGGAYWLAVLMLGRSRRRAQRRARAFARR